MFAEIRQRFTKPKEQQIPIQTLRAVGDPEYLKFLEERARRYNAGEPLDDHREGDNPAILGSTPDQQRPVSNPSTNIVIASPSFDEESKLFKTADSANVEGCHSEGKVADGEIEDGNTTDINLTTILGGISELEMQSTRSEMRADRVEVERFLVDRTFTDVTPNKQKRTASMPYQGVGWHATVSKSWRTNVMAVINFLMRASSKVSYNMVVPNHQIEKANKLYLLVSEKYTAWHAGVSKFFAPKLGKTLTDGQVNAQTFGIAIDHSNNPSHKVSQHQFNGMVAAAIYANKKLGIPLELPYHKLHLELAPERKEDITRQAVLISEVLAEAKRIIAEQNAIPVQPNDGTGPQTVIVDKARVRKQPNLTSLTTVILNKGDHIYVGKEVEGTPVKRNSRWGALNEGGDSPITGHMHSSLYKRREVNRVMRVQAQVIQFQSRVEQVQQVATKRIETIRNNFRRAA